jgi:hypothetical protein
MNIVNFLSAIFLVIASIFATALAPPVADTALILSANTDATAFVARTMAEDKPQQAIILTCLRDGPCDRTSIAIPFCDTTVAYHTVFDKLNEYNKADQQIDEQKKHGIHNPLSGSTDSAHLLGGPKTTRVVVCTDPEFQGFCDYPLITDGVCQKVRTLPHLLRRNEDWRLLTNTPR